MDYSGPIPPSATRLTPLELNAVKLDIRHTVLSPAYLEELSSQNLRAG